jgi:undecaprenyl diphosphate synthase
MTPDGITEAGFASALDTAGSPDPDLLIRTSGEMRVSNFLLWQIAYSEIHVTPVLWPDFEESDLCEAVLEYQRRERRFGRVIR